MMTTTTLPVFTPGDTDARGYPLKAVFLTDVDGDIEFVDGHHVYVTADHMVPDVTFQVGEHAFSVKLKDLLVAMGRAF